MVRTFLDSGVLLAASRSLGRDKERALKILVDANRTSLTSPFVHLELESLSRLVAGHDQFGPARALGSADSALTRSN